MVKAIKKPTYFLARIAYTESHWWMETLITEAHHTLKREQPFTAHEEMVTLIKRNRGDVRSQYITNGICQRRVKVLN